MDAVFCRANVRECNLRPCTSRISDIITNEDEQVDDLFHREVIFITEQKDVFRRITLSLKLCIVF